MARRGVVFQHQRLEPFFQHMGINLCRADIGMAQQRLDGAQIGAAFQQVGGKGVAQHMRADARRVQPRRDRHLFQRQKEPHAAEMPGLAARREQRLRLWFALGAQSAGLPVPFRQPRDQCRARGL